MPDMRLGDRYVLQRQLRREDEVTIWLAHDTVLSRSVEIRTVQRGAAGAERADRLERTAREAAGLTHPNVIHVLDVGTDGDVTYIVTEHPAGTELFRILEDTGPIDPERAISYAIQILTAFETARAAGISHGPISTTDVIVVGTSVKVSGFATADAADAYGPADDVRAAGGLLYEMLAATPSASEGPPRPVRAFNPRIPKGLDAVTVRALATDPDERYRGPRDMIAALSRMRRERSPDPAPGDHHPGAFRSWMLVPLILVVLTVAAIGIGIALGKLELGGPLGVRPVPAPAAPSPDPPERRPMPHVLTPVSVEAFDPFGDQQESASRLAWATDGDGTTAWQTEDYFDGELGKPGVGLVLDLGSRMTVTKFRLAPAAPGYDFRVAVGDDPGAMARAGGRSYRAGGVTRERIRPADGRYVLIWITSVVPMPDGTHRASIREVTVEGFDD